jgi:hypothetical protein
MENLFNSIGKIELNLRSLEFALRLLLHDIHDIKEGKNETVFNLMKVSINEHVPENYLSNYDTLAQLIKKVNFSLKDRNLPERIDYSIVILRDTLAHGRILANHPEGPYRIIKFSKAKDAMVQVESVFDITPEWLASQVKKTENEMQKMIIISHQLGLKIFPEE